MSSEKWRPFCQFLNVLIWAVISQESTEGSQARDTFGGRLTPDFVAERLGHANFTDIRELDFPQCSIRTVDLGNGEQFQHLRR